MVPLLSILLQTAIFGTGPETTIRIFLTTPEAHPAQLRVNVVLKTNPGWHTYWQNPGDSGLPPSVKWSLPEGWTTGPLTFPAPEAFVTPSEVTFGFSDSLWFYQDITPSGDQTVQMLTGSLRWLVCKEECVPGRFLFSLPLPPPAERTFSPDPAFPGSLPLLNGVWTQTESGIQIRIPAEELPVKDLQVFPEKAGLFQSHAGVAETTGNQAVWNFQPFSPVNPLPDSLFMVVVWKDTDSRRGRRVLINRLQN